MKLRYLAAILILVGYPGTAFAQGVTRLCTQTVNPITGANNCVDIGPVVPQANIGVAASSFTLCSGPCNVLDVNVIANATAIFAYVFDATSLPGNGTVGASAKVAFPVASGQMVSYMWGGESPAAFVNGAIIACSSSVPPTFTASVDCEFFGRAH